MALRTLLAALIVWLAGIPAMAHAGAASTPPPVTATATATVSLPSDATPAGQTLRLQRLGVLAALWGEIRYFHPYLATRDIDWDRALVETIPRVGAATSPAQFRAAIDHLLGFLHDPTTRTTAVASGAASNARDAAEPGLPADAIVRQGEVVRIDFARLAEFADRGGSQGSMRAALQPAIAAMADARPVVLDARARRPPGEDHYSAWMASLLVRARSNAPLLLGALRYRQYYGYESQTGSLSSGGYHSGLGTDRPVLIQGEGDAPLPPMVVLVNADSALPGELLSGLQATGRARVIAEGDADFGASPRSFELGEGMRAQLRTTELVGPDGTLGFHADTVTDAAGMERAVQAALAGLRSPARRGTRPAGRVAATDQQRGELDRAYPEMVFPSREYRLLALFRVWNVIDKFFPYRDLIGPAWNDVLARYIPKFEANTDAVQYQLTLRQLVAELHDSHAGLNGTMLSAEHLGRYLPPAMPRYLEGETVIAHVFDEGAGLRIGDTVLRVDGRPVAELRERMASYTSGSTPQAVMRDVHRSLFRGRKDSPIVFGVRGVDGRPREVALTRSVEADDPRLAAFEFRQRSTPVFGLLPGKVGYVDLARLLPSEVDAMFAAIAPAPATIFDMRGYPNGTAWPIAPRLTTRKNPVAALFRAPAPDGRGRADPELRDAAQLTPQRLPDANGPPYLGRVVMLVNEWTQSQAEATALFFEAATDVQFIGTPTAGANGDVTELVLPGAIAMQFSGHDVRHADGRQLQRLGIQPHLRVAPTIGGLVRGEDEVLAAALRSLEAR